MKFIIFIKHIAKVILKKETISFTKTNLLVNTNIPFYSDINYNLLTQNNPKCFKNLITIDGPGFSGSSAFGDLLGEFSNCTSLGGVDMKENPDRGKDNTYEIDFFREPNGIFDLERICYTNVGRIRDNAVQEFIKICLKYYYSGIKIYNDQFLTLAKKFIKDITDFTIPISKNKLTYVPKNMSIREYRVFAKDFLINFLKTIPSEENLVLDNLMAISKPDIETLHEYFGDFKLIYVFSDPRDIYARARLSPGNDWVPINPEVFVRSWNRVANQYKQVNDSSLYCASFDNLCNNYENEYNKLLSFLNLSASFHTNKNKFFNPDVSINNTKVYKKLTNQKPINYIFENLQDYCWTE